MICKSSKLMFSDLQRTWGTKLVMMHLVLRATEAFQLHVLFLYVCVCMCRRGLHSSRPATDDATKHHGQEQVGDLLRSGH